MKKADLAQHFRDSVKDLTTTRDYRLNVIYLTMSCNFRCKYCFEKEEKATNNIFSKKPTPANTCSESEIENFLRNVENREWDHNGKCIVVMGGEPFLAWEKLKHLIGRTIGIFSQYNLWTTVCIFSNSSFFGKDGNTELWMEQVDQAKRKMVSPIVSISYDGSGQKLRSRPGYVEANIERMLKANIPMEISYTVNELNFKKVARDLRQIIKNWDARIQINIDRFSLEHNFGLNFEEFCSELQTKFRKEIQANSLTIPVAGEYGRSKTDEVRSRMKIYQFPSQPLKVLSRDENFEFSNVFKS